MLLRIHLRTICAALAIALASLLAPNQGANPAAIAATSRVVNDAGSDCGSLAVDYIDMQAAVTDSIDDGIHTLLVCPGDYGAFEVAGANKLTIKAALPGTYPTIAPPAAPSGAIVYVHDSVGVTIDGLRIDGDNFADILSGLTAGVYFYNASGTVQNSIITKIRCFPAIDCGFGHGILLDDDNGDGKVSSLTVKNTNLTDVHVGISANGQVKLTVTGVRITGKYSGGTGASPEGISFFGVQGLITKNNITSVQTGVSLYASNNVIVSGNAVSDVETGIVVGVDCGSGNSTTNSNKITGNTFLNVTGDGMYISNADNTGCAHIDKNTISGNRFIGAAGSGAGVFFSTVPGASAAKNKISGNSIFGFGAGVVLGDPGIGSVSKNSWVK